MASVILQWLEIELSPPQHATLALAVNPFRDDQNSTWGNSYFKYKLWVSLLICAPITVMYHPTVAPLPASRSNS